MTLSLCMIVKNEADCLADCLASVVGVVDEIVVVDTGSTDDSGAIAQGFGARVIPFEWVDDFSAARNESLRHATGDWILVLDADERLAPGHGPALRALLSDASVAGYSLVIENRVGSAHDYSSQHAPAFRLFRNMPTIRYAGRIHEDASASARQTGMALKPSTVRIVHLGYLSDWREAKRKRERNLPLLERQVAEQPDSGFACFNLAEALKLMDRLDQAEWYYRRALSLLKRQRVSPQTPYYANLYFSLADLYRLKRDFKTAHQVLDEAIALYPTLPDLTYTKGLAHHDSGEHERAIAQFERCLSLADARHDFPTDPAVTGEKAHEAIAACHLALGDRTRAREHLKKALETTPRANTHVNLGILLSEAGEATEAESHFRSALELNPHEVRANLNLAAMEQAAGRWQEAIAHWDQALAGDPSCPDVRVLKAECLLGHGLLEEARVELDEELRRHPDSRGARLNRGMLAWLSGDGPAARGAWQRVVDDPIAQSLMALSWVTDGHPLPADRPSDGSIVLAWRAATDMALRLDRTDPLQAVLDRLAELGEAIAGLEQGLAKVFLARGLPDLAISCLVLAQARHPEDPEVYLALGEACLGAGNRKDALPMFLKAQELDPASTHARERLQDLATGP
jgi:tetratricopeptide (TPR) repeat protein